MIVDKTIVVHATRFKLSLLGRSCVLERVNTGNEF